MVLRNPMDPGWPTVGERTESEATAEQWKWSYHELALAAKHRRIFGLGRSPQVLSAAIEGYLEHREHVVERSTYQGDRTGTGHLLRGLGAHTRTNTIGPEALQGIVDELLREGYEPSTLATYLKVWRVFLEWCHFGVCGAALRGSPDARRRLAEFFDPTTVVVIPNRGHTDVETIADEDIPRLFEAAAKIDELAVGNFPSAVLAVGIGLYMGARKGEIFALSWQDIRPEARSVRIQYQVPKDSTSLKPLKGKLARTALVMPDWWPLHRRDTVGFVCARNGKPVGTRTQNNLITRVLDTAGLNAIGRGWHVLRHTYARQFIEKGGRLEELQKSLGHTSVVTTETRYSHFHEDVASRLAAERIYGA